MKDRLTSARGFWLVLFSWAALAYWQLHLTYRIDNIDDPWVMSFIHNFIKKGIEQDITFSGELGVGGTVFFGKLQAFIYAFFFEFIGWTRSSGHFVSTIIGACALWVWFQILINRGYSKPIALAFCFTLGFTEPFFGAANQIRGDILVFALSAGALLLALRGYWFFAGLLSAAALETHPMGLLAFFHLLIAMKISGSFKNARVWKRAFLGGALGGLLYFALHPINFQELPAVFSSTGKAVRPEGSISFIWEYFFKTKYYRHIPELVLTLASAWLLWRQRDRHPLAKQAFWLLLAFCTFGFLIPRPNFHYMVHVMPAFVLSWVVAAESLGKLSHLLTAILIVMGAQYGLVWHKNHGREPERQFEHLRAMIPEDDKPVVGPPMYYFAFMDRDFRTGKAAEALMHNSDVGSYWKTANKNSSND